MNIAYKLYCEIMDLDYLDYVETLQNDLEYIQDLINKHGVKAARKILKQFFE